MTPFIIIAVVITLIALGLLIVPLLRTRNTISYERQAQNIHYAKERLEELEEQLKNASISASDYEALKLEIESTLAHDIDIAKNSETEQSAGPRRPNKLAIGFISIFIPLSAIGFYLMVGTPEAISLASEPRQSHAEVDDYISGLEKRLEETPDDLQGWQLLSQTYLALGRYTDAKRGYLRVLTLGGEAAHVYSSLADAVALDAGGQITQEAADYVRRALALEPTNRQALWLAGLSAMQIGDEATAKRYWTTLMPLLDDAPKQQKELGKILEETFTNSATEIIASQNSSSDAGAATQTGLVLEVSLGTEISQLADADDLVFIFARAQQGPPAPLAVKRLRVSDLPATVTLSDTDAMIAAMSLSKFENVVVSARVSKSGQPVAQAGDLQSEVVPTKNTAKEPIELTISNVVK